ncbi:hypothetical protein SELMODRAFT_34488, partial [Selaginella moellendorffii]
GRRVHAHIVKHGFDRDILVANSIIQMYGSCGCVDDARAESRALFDSMVDRSSVSWNAMISAYAQSAQFEAALHLFRLMNHDGCRPDRSTFVNALGACCELTALQFGRMIHAQIAESGLERECMVATALINLHGKCGNLEGARAVFDLMEERTIISWTAMITAYSQNGQIVLARQFFDRMPHWCGIEVDASSTFVSLLAACSHGGMLREGVELFRSMVGDFGVEPVLEHFLCLVDLLGRAGQLDRALELVTSMPYQADAVAWVSLLSACSVHADKARGALATSSLLEIDRSDAAS